MSAQDDFPDGEDLDMEADEDDEDAPELVPAEDARPSKRQRKD